MPERNFIMNSNENKPVKPIMEAEAIEKIEEIIGYSFKRKGLLEQAFIRKSFDEEEFLEHNNEVLEFYGNTALDIVIVKLFASRYGKIEEYDEPVTSGSYKRDFLYAWQSEFRSDRSEKELSELQSNLVRTEPLAKAIGQLGLQQYLLMGKGDIKQNVQNEPSVMEDLFEAILGAIALDCDWHIPTLEAAVERMLRPHELLNEGVETVDYVGKVASYWQKEYNGELPPYHFTKTEDGILCELFLPSEESPETVQLLETLNIRQFSYYGMGKSKSEATLQTAKKFYEYLSRQRENSNVIQELVGDPDRDRAVNQLQELWQKRVIGMPEYDIHNAGINEKTGNNEWECECSLPSLGASVSVVDTTKADAKRMAAFMLLMSLKNEKINVKNRKRGI